MGCKTANQSCIMRPSLPNGLISFMVLLLLTWVTACKKELFIECESFEDKGGWVVDPQFVEQVGSPYLMAHGMGVPVENASTTVEFPSAGTYQDRKSVV